MTSSLAYISAFLSSVCFGLSSVLQHIGAKRLKSLESLNPLHFIPLLKQIPYATGLFLDGLGFVFFLVAVHRLPLFFVQAVDTSSIAVIAIASRYLRSVRLTPRVYRLMAAMIVGLCLLTVSAAPGTATPASNNFKLGLLSIAVLLVVGCVMRIKRINQQPLFTAFLSGLCFSGVAIAGRLLPNNSDFLGLLASPLLLALLIYGLLGIMLFSIALRHHDSVTHIYAVTFVTETLISASIGLLILGDAPRKGLWVVMLVGMVITLMSTTVIALTKNYQRTI